MADVIGAGPVSLDTVRTLVNPTGYMLLPDQRTYSIPTASSVWPGYDAEVHFGSHGSPYQSEPYNYGGFVSLSPSQAAQFVSAIELWDSYIAPDLVQTDDVADPGFVRIAFGYSGNLDFSISHSYAGDAAMVGQPQRVGDIWLNTIQRDDPLTVGSYDRAAMLGEIGHVLGLGSTNASSYGVSTPVSGFLLRFTLRDYQLDHSITVLAADTPGILDIAAVQSIYGADTTTATGNDTYRFAEGVPIAQTIWDAGGIDTIDTSNLSHGSIIDLRPGSYSSIGYQSVVDQETYWINAFGAQYTTAIVDTFNSYGAYTGANNFGIAYGTIIENAVGGSASDRLIGNDASNFLSGGGGQ